MATKKRFVLSAEQIEALVNDPPYAAAVFTHLKSDPTLSTKEAFAVARYSMRQMALFDKAVADGAIVPVNTMADVDANKQTFASIDAIIEAELAVDDDPVIAQLREKRAPRTNVP